MADNDDIRELLQGDQLAGRDRRQTSLALRRARRQVGQRDTLALALVRIWAVLARILAPFFAAFGQHQTQALGTVTKNTKSNSKGD